MTKRKRPATKKTSTPKVLKVELPKDKVLEVVIPPGVKPVVLADKDKVAIIPVAAKNEGWWRKVFG